MNTWKRLVAAGLLILGSGALATSAEAKVKITNVDAGGGTAIARPCVGQEFFSYAAAAACVTGTLQQGFQDGPIYSDSFFYIDGSGQRRNAQGKSYTFKATSSGSFVQQSPSQGYFTVTGDGLVDNQYPLTVKLNYGVIIQFTGSPEPEKCTLNAKWASWGLPKRLPGTEPPAGAKFRVAYQTDIAMPAVITDGGSTAPGHLFKVEMSEGSECTFRRETRVHLPADDPSKVGVMVYTVSIWTSSGQTVGDGTSATEVDEIVVTAKRKISKPIVPYGTRYDDQKRAKIESDLIKAFQQLYGTSCGSNCQSSDGRQIPVTVVATQENPSVNFVHPAPDQLARDNPACTQTYDPRCAWNPSSAQPATAQTPPDQLVRMSNDGQTIVHNNTSVYNNTVYPDAMRDAGTAPGTTTPGAPNPTPGTTDDPADPQGEDGEGKGLKECAETEGCGKLTNGSVRSYIEAVGADPDKDQSPGGVAGGILDRAVESGSCSSDNSKNPYCQMVAGFAMMKAGEGGSGDYVWWEGEIGVGPARKFHQATIPGSLLDAVDEILGIFFLVICWNIALRGKA